MNYNQNVEAQRYNFVWEIAMQFTSDDMNGFPDVSDTMSSKAKHWENVFILAALFWWYSVSWSDQGFDMITSIDVSSFIENFEVLNFDVRDGRVQDLR